MHKWIKEWLGITALEKRAEAADKTVSYLSQAIAQKEAELERMSKRDLDIGVRGNCTIILTGIYRGRGYIQFYDVHPDQFSSLVEEWQWRRKNDPTVRIVDAPREVLGSFKI